MAEDGTLTWESRGYGPVFGRAGLRAYSKRGSAAAIARRRNKAGKVAELDTAALISEDATPQEKLEHYEAMMLKYGALMDALRQEIRNGG